MLAAFRGLLPLVPFLSTVLAFHVGRVESWDTFPAFGCILPAAGALDKFGVFLPDKTSRFCECSKLEFSDVRRL